VSAGTRSRPVLSDAIASALGAHFGGPFYCTPDGLQAPLLAALHDLGRLETVAREDIAIGLAAGACLAGRSPVVLMQNSGLGQSVNALASLVLPYGLAMQLVVGMRGMGVDTTAENLTMGRITRDLLRLLDIPALTLPAGEPGQAVAASAGAVAAGRTAALLIPPHLFGWRPAR
jgi:sulfopyruvate decarboxylase subunit alpha